MAHPSPEAPGSAPLVLGPLSQALGYHLLRAQSASFRRFQRSTGMDWLKPGWFIVLSLINDNPDITAVELGRATGRDKSTMTPLLRALERDGLIARSGVPEDRRRHALRLTEGGRAALVRLAVFSRQHEATLDGLAGDDKAAVIGFLRRLTDAFN